MKKPLRRSATFLSALLLLWSLSGCAAFPPSEGGSSPQPDAGTDAEIPAGMDFTFTNRELDGSWQEEAATLISFSSSGISVQGNGASVSGNRVTLSAAGVYVLSGSSPEGQVLVEAGAGDKVQLVLNGLTLSCSDHAPLFIRQADKVFVTLAEGTQNVLTGGKAYSLPEEDGQVDGVIFSRADLAFNGNGSLSVTAAGTHGIVSKDDLVITSGAYTVTAAGDGLQGKDCVKIRDGSLEIQAGGDGIKSNNDEDADRGFVYLEGGRLTIEAATDGIQAETVLRAAGAALDITAGGGSQNASTDSSGSLRPGWGVWTSSGAETADSTSAKGMKAGQLLLVEAGTIVVDSSDDALHSNGGLTVSGGSLTLASGDDGIHADATAAVSGGDLTITRSYEGIEGSDVLISGGVIRLTASDDGVNSAGGNDGSSVNGRPGQNTFQQGGSHTLRITGGFLSVNAGGDGLDSNGSLFIEGGVVLISGPTNNANGALDYEQTGEISGGVLIAAGSAGMAVGLSASSTQNSFMYGYSADQPAVSRLTLTDESGTVLLSWAPEKVYQNVVISTPDLALNTSYLLYSGGEVSDTGTEGYTSAGTLSGAQKVADITLDSVSSVLGSAGGMGAMGPGGMGNRPGSLDDRPGDMGGEPPEDRGENLPGGMEGNPPGDRGNRPGGQA
ncbi:MAG: carbohydrate-binding domain-containing protein [Clostridiales bacterium]|nr:carbohydrate-binding domain-containing protein [Clostridiales bacterium]